VDEVIGALNGSHLYKSLSKVAARFGAAVAKAHTKNNAYRSAVAPALPSDVAGIVALGEPQYRQFTEPVPGQVLKRAFSPLGLHRSSY